MVSSLTESNLILFYNSNQFFDKFHPQPSTCFQSTSALIFVYFSIVLQGEMDTL